MGQNFTLGDDHLLCGEAPLVAFGHTQTLFVFFDFDLNPAAAQVIEANISEQDRPVSSFPYPTNFYHKHAALLDCEHAEYCPWPFAFV
jgi:hypothetical protein